MTIASHQASRVRCRLIAEDDLEGLADLLSRGFPHTHRDYWTRGFARWQRLPAISADIHLVSGDPALPDRDWIAALSPEMAARIPGARLTVLRYVGHMMIFEEPETCRRMVLDEIQGRGFSHA